MIDANVIRENPDAVKNGISLKNAPADLVDKFIDFDARWRDAVSKLDSVRADKKRLGKDDRENAISLKEQEKELEKDVRELADARNGILEQIPNLPEERVPKGKDESDNVELRKWGEPTEFDFKPKEYMEIAGALINTEKAGEVSGSRFGYVLGDLAVMEFALVKYVFGKLLPHGFIPVVPPVLVKADSMRKMGKFKFISDGDAYHIPDDDLYLVGTAEDSIGPIHMNETFSGANLPRRYVGFSTAFRREAGSYGKDTKGILRVHQFDKIEMFSFTRPEDSVLENDFLLERQEEIMQGLGLPYRVVHISTGDMGFTATNQYDIEAWVPSEGKYRETHSCSNTTDFQSRGLNIKCKDGGSAEFVHMLNATGAAIGRTLIAIIENYQKEDGGIVVPEALREYVGKSEIAPPQEF